MGIRKYEFCPPMGIVRINFALDLMNILLIRVNEIVRSMSFQTD